MDVCSHTSWVDVSGDSRLCLADPKRLNRLAASRKDTSDLYPRILLLIGKGAKRQAIKQIFPDSGSPTEDKTLSCIHGDRQTANSKEPIFFVDSELDIPVPLKPTAPKCHDTKSFRAEWEPEGREVSHIILSRLLFPFVDTVCVFADDIGGLEAVEAYINIWSSKEKASTLPATVRPRLIIITSKRPYRDLVKKLQKVEARSPFSFVQIIRGREYQHLRSRLVEHLDASQSQRRVEHTSFALPHLAWFFTEAVAHVARTITEPFDFVRTSRIHRPLPESYTKQLRAFFELAVGHNVPTNSVIVAIASSILLDAYSSSAHSGSSLRGIHGAKVLTEVSVLAQGCLRCRLPPTSGALLGADIYSRQAADEPTAACELCC